MVPVIAQTPLNILFNFCNVVSRFWVHVKQLIFERFQIRLDYIVLEILLGTPCKKNAVIRVINFVILYVYTVA